MRRHHRDRSESALDSTAFDAAAIGNIALGGDRASVRLDALLPFVQAVSEREVHAAGPAIDHAIGLDPDRGDVLDVDMSRRVDPTAATPTVRR